MFLLEIKKIMKKYPDMKWEVFANKTKSYTILMKDNEIKMPEHITNTNIVARVIIKNKVGVASTNNIKNWEECFNNAVKIARVNEEQKYVPELSEIQEKNKSSRMNKKIPINKLFDYINMMKNTVESRNEELSIIECRVGRKIESVKYLNSNSNNIELKDNFIAGYMYVGKNNIAGEYTSMTADDEPDFEKIVLKSIQRYNNSRNNIRIKPKKYDIILDQESSKTVLSPILNAVLADNILRHQSKYEEKKGEKIISDKLSVFDDSTNKEFLTYSICDAEGNNTKRTSIIKKGVLKNFLHDSYTSHEMNESNTYNSSTILRKPSVSFNNIIVMPGKFSEKEMIEECGEGIIFHDLYPSHVVNQITGDFGLNSSSAFYIKNGEIKGRVKDLVIAGNSFEVFKKIKSLSKKRRRDVEGYVAPLIKIRAKIIV